MTIAIFLWKDCVSIFAARKMQVGSTFCFSHVKYFVFLWNTEKSELSGAVGCYLGKKREKNRKNRKKRSRFSQNSGALHAYGDICSTISSSARLPLLTVKPVFWLQQRVTAEQETSKESAAIFSFAGQGVSDALFPTYYLAWHSSYRKQMGNSGGVRNKVHLILSGVGQSGTGYRGKKHSSPFCSAISCMFNALEYAVSVHLNALKVNCHLRIFNMLYYGLKANCRPLSPFKILCTFKLFYY